MNFKDLSITFHHNKIKEICDFYTNRLGAKITFDCGWYATIQLMNSHGTPIFLSFMEPKGDKNKVANGGVTLNLRVDDVDAEYEKLRVTDICIVDEIADHEWGDRSFTVCDPIGNTLYIYSDREMSDMYKNAIK